MDITDETRKTAFTACWNYRVKLMKQYTRFMTNPDKYNTKIAETRRQIADLDNAINELRS